MAGKLDATTHELYMDLSFRPFLRTDGTIGRVGVQASTPLTIDPEVYPNLLTAAPAMYQALVLLKGMLSPVRDAKVIEDIEMVLAFAQNGYLAFPNIDTLIQGLKK